MTSENSCKSICVRWRKGAICGVWNKTKFRCTVCGEYLTQHGIFIKNKGKKYCKCCGMIVRVNPHTGNGKKALRSLALKIKIMPETVRTYI